MLILGIDTSAVAASFGVMEEETRRILCSGTINKKLTHSQTLLPMLEGLLKSGDIKLSDIGKFAITGGPGSFTGLRIGISAVKGMAFFSGKPCVSVSTLEALAYNLVGQNCIACCVMDARCNQFYNAMFRIEDNKITRLCEDRALFANELEDDLKRYNDYDERIIFVGDGAELAAEKIHGYGIAPSTLRYQSGASVCLCSLGKKEITARELMPSYLRLPQAERERMARMNQEKGNV